MRRLLLAVPALCTALVLGQATTTHAAGYNVATTSCQWVDSYGDVTTLDITYDYNGTSVYKDANSSDATFQPGLNRRVGAQTNYSGNGSYLTATAVGWYAYEGSNTPLDYFSYSVNMYPSGAYACS